MPSTRLSTATPFCKKCGKPIEKNSLFSLFFARNSLCLRCFRELKPSFFRWKIGSIQATAIYPYEQEFQTHLYLYKGCGDIELAPTFLCRVRFLLQLRYFNYHLVYVPSHPNHIEKRGFDHVPLIFKGIGKSVNCPIEKTKDVKQADLSKQQRKNIGQYMRLTGGKSLMGKRILLVDDVYTTGSSIKSCIRLLKRLKPKSISVLVLAKVSLGRNGGKHSARQL